MHTGALEFVIGLDTYAHNVVSMSELEVFVLDNRNIDHLFSKAKHSTTSAYLVDKVQERLMARLAFGSGSKVRSYRQPKHKDNYTNNCKDKDKHTQKDKQKG